MDPLAGYLVDGDFLVGLYSVSGNGGGEQLFQEVVDRLQQDHVQPIFCHGPPAVFSPGEYATDDEYGKRGRKEIHKQIEAKFGQLMLCSSEDERDEQEDYYGSRNKDRADVASDHNPFFASSCLYPWPPTRAPGPRSSPVPPFGNLFDSMSPIIARRS